MTVRRSYEERNDEYSVLEQAVVCPDAGSDLLIDFHYLRFVLSKLVLCSSFKEQDVLSEAPVRIGFSLVYALRVGAFFSYVASFIDENSSTFFDAIRVGRTFSLTHQN